MSTQIRPETSQKNPYWIPKHRYYELKHFVMQYPAWVAARKGLDFLHTPTYCVRVKKDTADPTMTGASSELWMRMSAICSKRDSRQPVIRKTSSEVSGIHSLYEGKILRGIS